MPFFRSVLRQVSPEPGPSGPYDDSYFIRAEVNNVITVYGMPSMVNCLYEDGAGAQLNYQTKVIVGANVTNCRLALSQYGYITGRQYFNNNVIFEGNNVYDLSSFLSGAANFNCEINFPESVRNYAGIFSRAEMYNQPTSFTSRATELSNAFAQGTLFNSTVSVLGNNQLSVNMDRMLYNCQQFNKPITMPYELASADCSNMFNNCRAYNQVTYIVGKKGCNMYHMMDNCISFGSDIYVNCLTSTASIPNHTLNVKGLFLNCNSRKRKNIHFNAGFNSSFNNTLGSNTLAGINITWTAMTNGFYNATYNIYCYNNYNYLNVI